MRHVIVIRNKTTVQQVTALENGQTNPLTEKPYSEHYRKLLEQRRKLPVHFKRGEFLEMYHKYQVIILSSDTGFGKTTQIPQFVFWDEYQSKLKIACTQPRRLAAKSAATRVAKEMDVALGQQVGYKFRFESMQVESETQLVYMTDGKLLVDAMMDRTFSKYCCIIVDEAHERTVPTDILLALLKDAVQLRSDLKVIIMSATLDISKFQTYFSSPHKAPVYHIQGEAYHVDEFYIRGPAQSESSLNQGEIIQGESSSYLEDSVRIVEHIQAHREPGHILVFMPGESDVEQACEKIRIKCQDMLVLPLYSALSSEHQERVFASTSKQKCVVATNIAETSLTIDGIVYVIDCGLAKEMVYNPRARLRILQTAPISQASANQRKGRAGRTRPGICFRLYTQDMFNRLQPCTTPAIARAELKSAVLQVQRAGSFDVWAFDWLDRPAPEALLRAIEELKDMGFLDQHAKITAQGRQAAESPIDPIWYHTILKGITYGCAMEMIAIAALSSTQNSIFVRPFEYRYAADIIGRPQFAHPFSDHITLLNAYSAWSQLANNVDKASWCEAHGLSDRILREVGSIHRQLRFSFTSLLNKGDLQPAKFSDPAFVTNIRKALAAGLFFQSAIRIKGEDRYKTVPQNFEALLSPESALVGAQHEWIVFTEFKMSAKQYLTTCTRVEPEWIMDLPYFAENRMLKGRDGRVKQEYLQQSFARVRDALEDELRAKDSTIEERK
ncbi:hypothetical protein JX266_003273 [Neoarthrinium moseri]|nr:hypothetical protein JX266_003273 [Neoarthrinium moseri]